MDPLVQRFTVQFEYKVYFTTGLFSVSNPLFAAFLEGKKVPETEQKILFVIDRGVADSHPRLIGDIGAYFSGGADRSGAGDAGVGLPAAGGAGRSGAGSVSGILLVPGGEDAKNDPAQLELLLESIDRLGIDRHSYLAAIGGGAVLDLAGYAAAIAHRGIRHIRIPTTVLSQNDSGIGVKNGINYYGKKNFLGTFAPPAAVFNDELFLQSLDDRNWRSGIAEAIKVALIRDGAFFEWIEAHIDVLRDRDSESMNYLIRHCAGLHLEHIAGGDPFETGSSRPLDFGHWSAHKLEQLTHFSLLHGEAVAMGIALDSAYSSLAGLLSPEKAERILQVLARLGFDLTHPLMQIEGEDSPVLAGLREFREHLGGRLTIMLLTDIGQGVEVHSMDTDLLRQAGIKLKNYLCAPMRDI
jgi:3-dehydroquinate synthase